MLNRSKHWLHYAPNLRVAVQIEWRDHIKHVKLSHPILTNRDATVKGLNRALRALGRPHSNRPRGRPIGRWFDRRIILGVYSYPADRFLIGDLDATSRTLGLLRNHVKQLWEVSQSIPEARVANTLEQVFAPAPHLAPDHPAHQPGHTTAFPEAQRP